MVWELPCFFRKRNNHMLNNPYVTFVIPTLNSASMLEDCLKSIRMQDYDKNKVEIVTPDGGSKDKSLSMAKSYGCKVVKNKKILAEPGFMLGAKFAKGELVVYMGADNRLSDKNWLKNMVKPFKDPKIIGAYPWHKNDPRNTWLTKYFNAFTDPVNHFILGSSCNPLYFFRNYPIYRKNEDYVVYSFNLKNFPMIAFDQGFMVRKSYNRPRETEYDDILPVLNLIKHNMHLAFVPNASNYHYTLEKGIFQYVKKMRWIIDNNITPGAKFGLPTRMGLFNWKRKIKFYFWLFYALSVIGPILYSLLGLIRDRKREWIYHTPITVITLICVVYEVLRLKLLKGKSLASRQ